MSRRSFLVVGFLVVCVMLMQTSLMAGTVTKEQRIPFVDQAQTQFGIMVDPLTGVTEIFQPKQVLNDNKAVITGDFAVISGNCTDCGTPDDPPNYRTIVLVVQALNPVVGGFGLSNVNNFCSWNGNTFNLYSIEQSDTCDLLAGDFVTFTIVGTLTTFAPFSLYLDICSNPPADITDSCDTIFAGDVVASEPIVGTMRYIPGNCFLQGSPGDEFCREQDGGLSEAQFVNTLTSNYGCMQTEVTRTMWATLQAAQPTLPADPSNVAISPTGNHPVQNVIWNQAMLFANLLSVNNGFTRAYYADAAFTIPIDATNCNGGSYFCNFNVNGYRLPLEGEWEFAARAGSTEAFPVVEPNYLEKTCADCSSGTHLVLETYGVYCCNNGGGTDTVGGKIANAWNLRDMAGNVAEWCWDTSGANRVTRGGGWDNDARRLRSADRRAYDPAVGSTTVGFRLVRTVF